MYGGHIDLQVIPDPGGGGILAPRLGGVPVIITVITERDWFDSTAYRRSGFSSLRRSCSLSRSRRLGRLCRL
ncbi:hypothetical protein D3C73_1044580 [compost metagenome]